MATDPPHAAGLAPELRQALGAVGRVSHALVSSHAFDDLAREALGEMREALGLAVAALYLPEPGRQALRLHVVSAAPGVGLAPRPEVDFDAAAWRLAVSGGAPLVFQEPAGWLGANPFEPAADFWLVLPLAHGGTPAGVVAAASRARLREAVQTAHRLVRARLRDLTAPAAQGGLAVAAEDACRRFAQRGLAVQLTGSARLPDVPPPVAAVAVRVLSEALANAERHAGATHVTVALTGDERELLVVVEDDGCGIPPNTVAEPGSGHFGLMLMHERTRSVGGELAVGPRDAGGTRVAARLPL